VEERTKRDDCKVKRVFAIIRRVSSGSFRYLGVDLMSCTKNTSYMAEIMRPIKLVHVFFGVLAGSYDKIPLKCHLEFRTIVREKRNVL
jgi:hypothetical protein